jgi:hypothetical protein
VRVAVKKPLTQALCESGQQHRKEYVIDRRRHTMTNYQYLIIGGGTTAAAAVDGIRNVDSISGIELRCAELDAPYDRLPLSKALWKGTPLDSIWRKTESRQTAVPTPRHSTYRRSDR